MLPHALAEGIQLGPNAWGATCIGRQTKILSHCSVQSSLTRHLENSSRSVSCGPVLRWRRQINVCKILNWARYIYHLLGLWWWIQQFQHDHFFRHLMITEGFLRNCNKVDALKWVIARMQPNGIRDKREDAPQNQAITISWQGNDVAVSSVDDSQALPGTE